MDDLVKRLPLAGHIAKFKNGTTSFFGPGEDVVLTSSASVVWVTDGGEAESAIETLTRERDEARAELEAASTSSGFWAKRRQDAEARTRAAEARATTAESKVDDLAMLVRMLVRHVPETAPVKAKAVDYLARHGLWSVPLRLDQDAAKEEP